jgi:hypothetical protein
MADEYAQKQQRVRQTHEAGGVSSSASESVCEGLDELTWTPAAQTHWYADSVFSSGRLSLSSVLW